VSSAAAALQGQAGTALGICVLPPLGRAVLPFSSHFLCLMSGDYNPAVLQSVLSQAVQGTLVF